MVRSWYSTTQGTHPATTPQSTAPARQSRAPSHRHTHHTRAAVPAHHSSGVPIDVTSRTQVAAVQPATPGLMSLSDQNAVGRTCSSHPIALAAYGCGSLSCVWKYSIWLW